MFTFRGLQDSRDFSSDSPPRSPLARGNFQIVAPANFGSRDLSRSRIAGTPPMWSWCQCVTIRCSIVALSSVRTSPRTFVYWLAVCSSPASISTRLQRKKQVLWAQFFFSTKLNLWAPQSKHSNLLKVYHFLLNFPKNFSKIQSRGAGIGEAINVFGNERFWRTRIMIEVEKVEKWSKFTPAYAI